MAVHQQVLLWKVLAAVFIGFDFLLTVAIYVVLTRQSNQSSGDTAPTSRFYASVRQASLFGGTSPFAPLSPRELQEVRNFANRRLGLVNFEAANLSDPYIYLIELLPPLKAQVVAYLDGRSPRPPERTARVVVFNGSRPAVFEFEAGPLERPDWLRPLPVGPSRAAQLPWSARPTDPKEISLLYALVAKELKKAALLWQRSFSAEVCDLSVRANGGRCLIFIDVAPRGYRTAQRVSWGYCMRSQPGFLLHPLPLYLKVQHEGPDPSTWRLLQVRYGEASFSSMDDLVAAFFAGNLRVIHVPSLPAASDSLFSDLRFRGDSGPQRPTRGPRAATGSGTGYSLTGTRLEFRDWSVHLGLRTGNGLALFDLRFAGERIAYELSNQEAGVFYSGRTPISGTCQYFDSAWQGLGLLSFELVPGVDCPSDATFLDTAFLVGSSSPSTNRRAVCIFEWNSGTPLGRHFTPDNAGGWVNYGGAPDHVVVIRQIATIYNYDYIYDVILHLDGSVEVKTSMTGYLQTGYASEVEPLPIVYPQVVGQLHQHIFAWKADLDIKGERNAFSTVSFPFEKVEHPGFPEAGKRTILTHRFDLKKTEKEALTEIVFREPKYFLQHASSKDQRGFRFILDNMAPPPLPPNELGEYGASFARYPITVTRRKERSEDTLSNMYSQNNPFFPAASASLADFYKDNESIVDEDLVVWVSQGVIHLPHTEDVPVTTTPTSTVRFFLQPYNLFKENPMVRSPDIVWMQPKSSGGTRLWTYAGDLGDKDHLMLATFNGTQIYP